MAKKNKNTAAETASDEEEEDEEEEADAGESQDEGDPTEDVAEGADTQPDGQTITGGATSADDDEFADGFRMSGVVEAPAGPNITRVDPNADNDDPPKLSVQLTKALGMKAGDLLGYNERTRVAVFGNGGKYQISKNGKSLRHLAGPAPRKELKLKVVDARVRGSMRGAAAVLNAAEE